MDGASKQDHLDSGSQKSAGCLARLYWMFIGNALFCFVLVKLAQKRPPFPAVLDVITLLVVASLVYVRYFDVSHCNGLTAEGQPASMDDWRKYALCVSVIGVAAWLAVRLLLPLL